MIAEASSAQEQRRLHERRRVAARQKTVEAMWDDVVKRQREALISLPPASRGPASAAVASPDLLPAPGPRAVVDSPRVFVVRNVIDGEAPVVRKPGPTFADVLRTFDPAYRRRYGAELTVQQDKVLREMLACYTPVLGTHEWSCGDCGTQVTLPNGCNNRHCCTCGGAKRRRWAETTCSQILPVEYCHLIFTVPKQITRLAMINPRKLYSMVLSEGAYAVFACGRKLFDIELALLSLLHSWGQLMLAHLHNHSLMPLGGLRAGALEWIDLSEEQLKELLEHVKREFPRRFCKALRKAYDQGELQFDGDAALAHLRSPAAFERWLKPLENRSWIIRCGDSWDRRKAGHGPKATMKVVEYLANYIGRIALSDSRILDIDGDHVLFKYKDYRDGNQQKTTWIEGVELIRRFLKHLLPPRMHHIRRYGWMARRANNEKLDYLRQYHGMADTEPEEKEEEGDEADVALEEPERTQTCRFCTGSMHLTGRTVRPRVWEVMEMPLSRFRHAQAGAIVTLGDKLPRILAARSGDESLPPIRERAAEIMRQLSALPTSGYL